MSKTTVVLVLSGMVAFLSSCAKPQVMPLNCHPTTDVSDGWRLGIQAWTFRQFTFYEAVDKTASLGLNWIEAYPGQRLSKEDSDVVFHHTMPVEIRSQVKQKLRDAGVKLVNYGVVNLPDDESRCREIFDFAKDMGIETIVSEPAPATFDLIDTLCQEYHIKVAIHNHPKPSRYWHPNKVMELCQGRSRWIGACGDTGHWMRSGVSPLEAIKELKGRIISFHFKDLNEFGDPAAHDVVWGTGKANVKALLKELHRQHFQGVFCVEYEHDWANSTPQIRQCVKYFNETASKLQPTCWHDLLADDLSNCYYNPGSWAMENGVLTRKGGGCIWTKEKFRDFILDLEFKLDKKSNSGVFIRTGDIVHWLHTAIEVQILDSYDKKRPDKHDCGAIYDCLAPSRNMVRPPGQWNHLTIAAQGNRINVVMNGEQIIDMDLDMWPESHKNPDGTKNKFNTAYKNMPRKGHIGFQDHGQAIWYRNIKIRIPGN